MSFAELGLSEPLLRAVGAEGYHIPTDIQIQTIPLALAGRDLIGCAQTGTGKTAAFALPTLDRLAAAPAAAAPTNGSRPRHRQPSRPIRALVLSPTRELAAQIGDSFRTYGRNTRLRHTVVYGGVGQGPQVTALRAGVDTLIATPGRLLDLMNQGHVDLSRVEILIFDEADQMLDMGFIPDMRRIVAAVPARRQTLMFSATMPAAIRKLAAEWLTNAAHVQAGAVATPVEKVAQSVYHIDKQHKPRLLTHLLETKACGRTLVFARTKHGADKLVRQLKRDGIDAAAIHGNKSQAVRQRVLAQFKSTRPPVLIATDVAARGLDIDDVSHVVNYDLPDVPETYVHRIGRTARAGAEGIAFSFCAADERNQLREIERLTRSAIAVSEHGLADIPVVRVAAGRADGDGRTERQGKNGSRRFKPGRPAKTVRASGAAPRGYAGQGSPTKNYRRRRPASHL